MQIEYSVHIFPSRKRRPQLMADRMRHLRPYLNSLTYLG